MRTKLLLNVFRLSTVILFVTSTFAAFGYNPWHVDPNWMLLVAILSHLQAESIDYDVKYGGAE